MTNQPGGRKQFARMHTGLQSAALLVAAAASLTIPLAARADKAQDVINKVVALYNGARTFKGTIRIVQSQTLGGQTSSVSMSQDLEYMRPNLISSYSIINSSRQGKAMPTSKGRVCSDGKTIYKYDMNRKLYEKGPAPPEISLATLLALVPRPGTAKFTLAADTVYNGRPAYVVILTPLIPANVPANIRPQLLAMSKPQKLTIDKRTSQLLRVTR
ncbi:MAG TPA: hypothetical protein VGS41_01195, partial [Chthonomonadales bacterium]|nr:hypothetical protein [Chthonomonadales bacterium]